MIRLPRFLPTGLLAALLLGSALLPAWPLEVSNGPMKVVLHPGIGRFSLYFGKTALLVDQDPRTSGLSLLLDGRVYKLGDGGEFRQSAEEVAGGVRFAWTSKRVTVTQDFAFRPPDAMLMTITIRNDMQAEASVGVRLLLDTYLGEEGFPHFLVEGVGEVDSELTCGPQAMPAWWLSRSSRQPEAPALQLALRGTEVTVPDRLVLANWKRLSDSPWLYEGTPARSFSELPYSINDSAACLYYGPGPLGAGQSRTIWIRISANREPPAGALPPLPPQAAPAVEAAAPAPAPTTPEVPPAAAAPGAEPAAEASAKAADSGRLKLSIQGDLRVVDDLLQQLSLKLEAKAPLSEQELQLMEQVLADLKKRLESYGD